MLSLRSGVLWYEPKYNYCIAEVFHLWKCHVATLIYSSLHKQRNVWNAASYSITRCSFTYMTYLHCKKSSPYLDLSSWRLPLQNGHPLKMLIAWLPTYWLGTNIQKLKSIKSQISWSVSLLHSTPWLIRRLPALTSYSSLRCHITKYQELQIKRMLVDVKRYVIINYVL